MREAGQDRQDGREACRAGGRQNKEGTKGGRQDRSQCREAGQEGNRTGGGQDRREAGLGRPFYRFFQNLFLHRIKN